MTRWPTYEQRLRPTTFCETVSDVKAEALVNTMHHSLAELARQWPMWKASLTPYYR